MKRVINNKYYNKYQGQDSVRYWVAAFLNGLSAFLLATALFYSELSIGFFFGTELNYAMIALGLILAFNQAKISLFGAKRSIQMNINYTIIGLIGILLILLAQEGVNPTEFSGYRINLLDSMIVLLIYTVISVLNSYVYKTLHYKVKVRPMINHFTCLLLTLGVLTILVTLIKALGWNRDIQFAYLFIVCIFILYMIIIYLLLKIAGNNRYQNKSGQYNYGGSTNEKYHADYAKSPRGTKSYGKTPRKY